MGFDNCNDTGNDGLNAGDNGDNPDCESKSSTTFCGKPAWSSPTVVFSGVASS